MGLTCVSLFVVGVDVGVSLVVCGTVCAPETLYPRSTPHGVYFRGGVSPGPRKSRGVCPVPVPFHQGCHRAWVCVGRRRRVSVSRWALRCRSRGPRPWGPIPTRGTGHSRVFECAGGTASEQAGGTDPVSAGPRGRQPHWVGAPGRRYGGAGPGVDGRPGAPVARGGACRPTVAPGVDTVGLAPGRAGGGPAVKSTGSAEDRARAGPGPGRRDSRREGRGPPPRRTLPERGAAPGLPRPAVHARRAAPRPAPPPRLRCGGPAGPGAGALWRGRARPGSRSSKPTQPEGLPRGVSQEGSRGGGVKEVEGSETHGAEP